MQFCTVVCQNLNTILYFQLRMVFLKYTKRFVKHLDIDTGYFLCSIMLSLFLKLQRFVTISSIDCDIYVWSSGPILKLRNHVTSLAIIPGGNTLLQSCGIC